MLRRWTRIVVVGTLALVAVGGCAGSSGLGESQLSSEELSLVDDQPTIQERESVEVPDGVDAKGVVLAALILANGDGVRAVEEGLVSPQEVDLAMTAIAKGNLQEWVQIAES